MIRQTAKRLIGVKYLFILIAMFGPCSLLLACSISEVTLNIGRTPAIAASDGLIVMGIPDSETRTAYFYATCSTGDNFLTLDIEWEFDFDGDDDFDEGDDDDDESTYDSSNFYESTISYSYSSAATPIKVHARFKDFPGDEEDNPWVESDACEVVVVNVRVCKEIISAKLDFCRYMGYGR